MRMTAWWPLQWAARTRTLRIGAAGRSTKCEPAPSFIFYVATPSLLRLVCWLSAPSTPSPIFSSSSSLTSIKVFWLDPGSGSGSGSAGPRVGGERLRLPSAGKPVGSTGNTPVPVVKA